MCDNSQVRSPEEAVQAIRAATNQVDHQGYTIDVYVASNMMSAADMGMLEQLLGNGQKIRSIAVNPPTDANLNTISHVEMEICRKAAIFVGTVGSTWTYNVQAMRGEPTGMLNTSLSLKASRAQAKKAFRREIASAFARAQRSRIEAAESERSARRRASGAASSMSDDKSQSSVSSTASSSRVLGG